MCIDCDLVGSQLVVVDLVNIDPAVVQQYLEEVVREIEGGDHGGSIAICSARIDKGLVRIGKLLVLGAQDVGGTLSGVVLGAAM